MKKALSILSLISGISLLIYLYRLFSSSAPVSQSFSKAAEKAAAEKGVKELKEEVKALDEKVYSEEEIKKLLN